MWSCALIGGGGHISFLAGGSDFLETSWCSPENLKTTSSVYEQIKQTILTCQLGIFEVKAHFYGINQRYISILSHFLPAIKHSPQWPLLLTALWTEIFLSEMYSITHVPTRWHSCICQSLFSSFHSPLYCACMHINSGELSIPESPVRIEEASVSRQSFSLPSYLSPQLLLSYTVWVPVRWYISCFLLMARQKPQVILLASVLMAQKHAGRPQTSWENKTEGFSQKSDISERI